MHRARADGPPEDIVLTVAGMNCRHCVRAISVHIHDVAGVVAVEADLESGTVRVQGTAPIHALLAAIAEAGYEALPSAGPAPEDRMRRASR